LEYFETFFGFFAAALSALAEILPVIVVPPLT